MIIHSHFKQTFLYKMLFYSTTWISFFILFQLKGIFSTKEICLENDITKHLDKWIFRIFETNTESAVELITAINDYELKEFEYNITNKVNHFQKKIFFQNINIYVKEKEESGSDELQPLQIHWEFSKNEMRIFIEELYITIWGTIGSVKGEKFSDFNASLYIENFTLAALECNGDNSLEISYNTLSRSFWHWLTPDTGILWTNENLTNCDKVQLMQEMESALPAMLHQNLNNNPTLTCTLDDMFQLYEKPRIEIISRYPEILNNPQQYYYLIPKLSFYCFTLKRIIIRGLSNFESFKAQRSSGMFTHILLIRNVDGKMILDYRFKNEPDLELNFRIDCLFVSKNCDTDCVYGQAKYYTVTRTKSNVSLSTRQSEVIMNGLESAIASSLLPSMGVERICDLETPLDKIKISNSSDWKTIKESYKGWIPFNDDEGIKK